MKTLDTWHNVDRLLSDYTIYVLERDKDDIESIIQNNELLRNHSIAFKRLSRDITSNLSSTYVRSKIKEGKSIQYLAPSEVVNYIVENKLYL